MNVYEALVMDDGHLAVAEYARNEMGLRQGERIEVTIRRLAVNAPLQSTGKNDWTVRAHRKN